MKPPKNSKCILQTMHRGKKEKSSPKKNVTTEKDNQLASH